MHAILLAVVVLVLTSTVVPCVGVGGSVRRCRCCVVLVGGRRGGVSAIVRLLGAWTSSPAGAVEGLTAGPAATASGDAGAQHEKEQEAEDDDDKDNPSDPIVPSRAAADAAVIPVVVTPSSHDALGVLLCEY